jgi:hypothetical protein
MRLKDPYQAGGTIGSIGGITFSINKGQQTARVRTKPVRRLRTTQPRNRSILGFLSRAWGDLTSAQRVDWESYAANHPRTNAFGQQFLMSGINAFTSLNHSIIRLYGWGAFIEDAPVVDPAASINNFAAATGAVNPGDIDLSWSLLGTGDASDKIEIRVAGPFISPGRQEVFEKKRYVQEEDGDAVASTLTGLIEGQWYWVFARYIDQYGQVTAWQVDQATPKVTV